eukprot:13032029-Alexandrium_andersonii.AAC.1
MSAPFRASHGMSSRIHREVHRCMGCLGAPRPPSNCCADPQGRSFRANTPQAALNCRTLLNPDRN